MEASGAAWWTPLRVRADNNHKWQPTALHTNAPESQLRCSEKERNTHTPRQNARRRFVAWTRQILTKAGNGAAPPRRWMLTCVCSRAFVYVFHVVSFESAASLSTVESGHCHVSRPSPQLVVHLEAPRGFPLSHVQRLSSV